MVWRLFLKQKRGVQAEQQALQYLQQQGLRLIDQNFACKTGEIDLIMLDQAYLVFIEVRFRSQSRYGSASSSITRGKQGKIRNTAARFLQHNPQHSQRLCRFDVVAIDATPDAPSPSVQWIQSAF